MGVTAFLVDDDPGVLKALSRMVRTAGYETRCYLSPRAFLTEHDPSTPGCAIVDLAMPDLDGLELQRHLGKESIVRPIIFLTGNGDIPTSVRAMKAGAVDFLTKPVNRSDLLNAMARAVAQDAMLRQSSAERNSIEARLSRLTPRERQVLEHVIAGRLNKQIAVALGTVEKTIKVHRARMMAKLQVRNVAELVRLAQQAGVAPSA